MQYLTKANLNLYNSPELNSLATQAAIGRFIQLLTATPPYQVCLCEDDYPGWLAAEDLQYLAAAETSYQAPVWSAAEIQQRMGEVIEFTKAAMLTPNQYLWGGTVAPNYDCSGLMQAAFASVGVRIPRDAYQQEKFVQHIAIASLIPGDLVFFGTPLKATHVGLYLGNNKYVHSSGKDQGRNGIGIDELSAEGDRVSRTYYAQLRGGGRVVASYQPGQK
ncbi:MAG: C40 family peptidase [Leptolyngbyaceae cyanobacterium CSU_1_3]|nr:C40 family peptidase [Leptolyngbyaceae cyanobacterium CSU_1_3]